MSKKLGDKFTSFQKNIWSVQTKSLPKWKAFWIRFLRIVLLTIRGFTKSQIQQGASSLTYYTLLAVVPIVAFFFAIARAFLLEKTLENWLINQFAEHAEIIRKVIQFAESALEDTEGGVIAGVGVALFLWAGIKILMNIERAMNQICEVKRGRPIAKRFSDYLALIFLCPILVVLSSGLTGYLSTALTTLGEKGIILSEISPLLLNLIPYLLICLLLTFLYIFIPNTRIRFLPALYSGLITGSIYQIVQWLYLYFQIGVTQHNVIYGTFAIVPLFLIWLHLSWVIVLLGMKITYALQNVDAYGFITEEVHLSHKFRTILSLRIAHLCIKKFCDTQSPPLPIEISNTLSIPLSLTSHLLFQLVAAHVLAEVKQEDDQDAGFQPARSIDQLTIKQILDMINARGEEIPLLPSHELDLIIKSLEKFNEVIEQSDGNILLKDI